MMKSRDTKGTESQQAGPVPQSKSPLDGPPLPEPRPISFRQLLFRSLFFLGLLLVFYAILFFVAQEQLLAASRWFAETLGWTGAFFYVLIVDTFIIPATADILFPIARDWAAVPLVLVISSASILGGFLGYLIGRNLNHIRLIRDMTAYYRSHGERLIQRYGVWAVVLAGLTPVPYSTVSWIAGMLRISPGLYLLGALSRIPRFALYYLAFQWGLDLLEFLPFFQTE